MTKITYIKAFTQETSRGNPAVVIEGAINSSQVIEAVQNAHCSVAALIDSSKIEPVPIRFFYEHGEIETFACGHATLAAAEVLLPDRESQSSFITTKGQIIKIVRQADGRITQRQAAPTIEPTNCSREEAAHALGLNIEAIAKDLKIEAVGTPGKMKLKIPLVSSSALLAIRRNHKKNMVLCNKLNLTGLFPFTLNTIAVDAHARHFPTRDEEDLVCGVGSIALAHYLHEHKLSNKKELVIRCGPRKEGVGDVIVKLNNGDFFLEGFAIINQ